MTNNYMRMLENNFLLCAWVVPPTPTEACPSVHKKKYVGGEKLVCINPDNDLMIANNLTLE